MKFLFILTHVEDAWKEAPGEAERVYQQYMDLESELKSKKKFIDSVRLRPCADAKTIRNLPGGKRTTSDGPWTNAKEAMGGYYVLDCDSMAEALNWAQRMPNYGHGSIEIRPFWE